METVSIALCTYNGEEFLAEQLRSIAAQSRLPDKLVICDDCSTDATLQIAEQFAETAPFPVTIIENESNLGSTKNFEKAILLASGDLIFLCDQDDVWVESKIELMTDRFSLDSELALLFSDAELVGHDLNPLGRNLWDMVFPPDERRRFLNEDPFEVMLWQNTVTGAAMAFRSRFREKIIPVPVIPGLIHDGWIAIALANIAKIGFIDKPLVRYRQHERQQLGVGVLETDRLTRFGHSIAISELEIERLTAMSGLIDSSQLFENRRGNGLIERYSRKRLDMIEHYRNRKDLSASLPTRIVEIYRELLTGRYGRYSNGMLSVAKDLILR